MSVFLNPEAIEGPLLRGTDDVFAGSNEVSLLCSVKDLSQQEPGRRLHATTGTVEEILYHVTSRERAYCTQASGKWKQEISTPFGEMHRVWIATRELHRTPGKPIVREVTQLLTLNYAGSTQ